MNSQDIFIDWPHLFYGSTLAGYFAKQFKASRYDIAQLRNLIDTTHLSESCTHKAEGTEILRRRDKAEIILKSIKQLRMDHVPEFIAIVFAGLAIFGSSDYINADTLNSLMILSLLLLAILSIDLLIDLYTNTVFQRLSDALEIIIKEGGESEANTKESNA